MIILIKSFYDLILVDLWRNDIFTMTVFDSSLKTRHFTDIKPSGHSLFKLILMVKYSFFPIGISAPDYINRDVILTMIMSMA